MVQIYTFKKHYASKNQKFLYFLLYMGKINIKKTKPVNSKKRKKR